MKLKPWVKFLLLIILLGIIGFGVYKYFQKDKETNPKYLKALFKVVIDDIEYEIFCVSEYGEYLEQEIARLSQEKAY